MSAVLSYQPLRTQLMQELMSHGGWMLWHQYWDGLRGYLLATSSRAEFEALMRAIGERTSRAVALHNQLIATIISNISSEALLEDSAIVLQYCELNERELASLPESLRQRATGPAPAQGSATSGGSAAVNDGAKKRKLDTEAAPKRPAAAAAAAAAAATTAPAAASSARGAPAAPKQEGNKVSSQTVTLPPSAASAPPAPAPAPAPALPKSAPASAATAAAAAAAIPQPRPPPPPPPPPPQPPQQPLAPTPAAAKAPPAAALSSSASQQKRQKVSGDNGNDGAGTEPAASASAASAAAKLPRGLSCYMVPLGGSSLFSGPANEKRRSSTAAPAAPAAAPATKNVFSKGAYRDADNAGGRRPQRGR